MENEIQIVKFTSELFAPFDWDVIEGSPLKSAYNVNQDFFVFDCYPNDILANGYPVFIANENAMGLTAYYLAGRPIEDCKDDELLFGLADPLSVFTAKKSQLTAVHAISGDFQLDDFALSEFRQAGLINTIASFSVGQQWRPWQDKTN